VKHVPETNGKVGILGISYDGFSHWMALVNPHPRSSVGADEPVVDGWMATTGSTTARSGSQMMPYIHDQEDARERDQVVDEPRRRLRHVHGSRVAASSDAAAVWSRSDSGEDAGASAYDALARPGRDKILATQPLNVPVMLVHSLWDQEDIYGDIAVYNAIEPKDAGNDKVFLVLDRGTTARRSATAARSAR